MKRYGEMSRDELREELDRLEAAKRNAEFPSQREMLEQKIWMAKAYLRSDETFPQGVYKVAGRSEPFELKYVNGVMAWGRIGTEDEASFPISMLERREHSL
ncbi:DUF1811 family protein [Paenibacillus sp. GYB003]|uniref:DUF1811 family protein n=1 Tax=Paenibacillus sp. GYB003 TaxID=2994392 RepID=UPI002F9695C5